PPRILSIQKLGTARVDLVRDAARRTQAVHFACADGVLVCPTHNGVLLGIDVATHSLLWSYSYRPAATTFGVSAPVPTGGPVSYPVAYPGAQNVQLPAWKGSVPVIAGCRVVFTAPDGDGVYCLDLRDGRPLWQAGRQDDLYLGGVFGDKVLLLGQSACRALSLADGKPLWRLEAGVPSGQGVAAGGVYYLPVRARPGGEGPGVSAIDGNQGKRTAFVPARQTEAPGNLPFYHGQLFLQV